MTLYREYDRAALDAQYNNRARVPNFAEHLARWKAASAAARGAIRGVRLDVPYGAMPAERLDIFPAAGAAGRPPVLVFLHGGYWRSLDKGDFSFLAQAYVAAGITYVSANYGLTPATHLDAIVRQVRGALAWLHGNPAVHGGDPNRLYVSGHSAGGHLAPLVLGTDWTALGSLPPDLVKGAVGISGLYDLEPMRLCYLNEGMNLDPDSVQRLSPIHQVPKARKGPLILCAGGDESPEFLRQQADYAKAWAQAQAPARLVAAPGLDHFTVMDAFCDANAALFKACRDLLLGSGRG